MDNQKTKSLIKKQGVSRRQFLKGSGVIVAGTGLLAGMGACDWLPIPVEGASEGYLLVDLKKCQGCVSCMLACSLAHEGKTSLSLARLQVHQNSFGKWPDDLAIEQCRQCVDAKCVEVCPVGAMASDPDFGYVRQVDLTKCVGCGRCASACPYTPSRPVLAPDDDYDGARRSRKCDLCTNAPYHWDERGGGVTGVQACVEVCPVGAIVFSDVIPKQEGDAGYQVNLRDGSWSKLGYSRR